MKMTHSIVILTVIIFSIGSIITSCMDSKSNTENVSENVAEAREKYNQDKEAYLEDIKNYKKEMDKEYESNKRHIAELRADKANEAKAAYNEKVAALEAANDRLKNKIDTYQAEGYAKWEIAKAEFSRDMSNLGQSLKDFTIKNNK